MKIVNQLTLTTAIARSNLSGASEVKDINGGVLIPKIAGLKNEHMTLIVLSTYARESEYENFYVAYPSFDTVRGQAGLAGEDTFYGHITHLINIGLLQVVTVGSSSNKYYFDIKLYQFLERGGRFYEYRQIPIPKEAQEKGWYRCIKQPLTQNKYKRKQKLEGESNVT